MRDILHRGYCAWALGSAEREKVIKQTAELDAQKYMADLASKWQEEKNADSGGKNLHKKCSEKNLAGFIINTEKAGDN